MKSSEPIVYGKDIRHIKFTTAKDIIELKNAGVSDEIIQAIIIFGSKDSSDNEREKAWDMLRNMGIILDMRRQRDERNFQYPLKNRNYPPMIRVVHMAWPSPTRHRQGAVVIFGHIRYVMRFCENRLPRIDSHLKARRELSRLPRI